jgi:hypothetical protein
LLDRPVSGGGEHRADGLYEEQERAEFPARLRDSDLAGVDLVLLDVDIAGCVATWLSSGGRLDAARLAVTRNGVRELACVLPLLTDAQEARYFERLPQLAQPALDEASCATGPRLRGRYGRQRRPCGLTRPTLRRHRAIVPLPARAGTRATGKRCA